MQQDRLVTLRLSDDLIAALAGVARVDGRAPADIIREALSEVLARRGERTDRIPAEVVEAFRVASDWTILQTRLRRMGFVLRLNADQHLALFTWPNEREIVPVERVGHTQTTLSLRFRAPFPGMSVSQRSAADFHMGTVVERLRAASESGPRAA